MRKILAAAALAIAATLAIFATNIGTAADGSRLGRMGDSSTSFYCFIGPVLGGNDELDASGMAAPVTWGRECGGAGFENYPLRPQPTTDPVIPSPSGFYKIPAGGM
jgi:hypothetical protein